MAYKLSIQLIVIAALCSINTGCGSVKPPVEKLAVADQMIKQADSNEAQQYAPLEFHLATEKLQEAKQAMEKEDYLIAERLADLASIDAKTALAKTDSVKAQKNLDELKQSIELLRLELKSKTNP